jgi:hypothetical protein
MAMKFSRLFTPLKYLLLGSLLNLFAATSAQAQESPLNFGIEPPSSILFVGNSFTFYNNSIYTHLRKLQVAQDPSNREKIFLKSMTISGALLSDHAGGLSQLMNSRKWDVVVLQGQSRELIDDETAPGFKTAARIYSEAIKIKGAEPVLFMTWAYSDRPRMTVQLANEFRRLGKKLDVMVIPVGLAFEQALENIPGLSLHAPDHKHPSLEGTYLAAAVFYAALYGRSPEELNYDAGLDESLARQLRQVAWQAVVSYYPAKK